MDQICKITTNFFFRIFNKRFPKISLIFSMVQNILEIASCIQMSKVYSVYYTDTEVSNHWHWHVVVHPWEFRKFLCWMTRLHDFYSNYNLEESRIEHRLPILAVCSKSTWCRSRTAMARKFQVRHYTYEHTRDWNRTFSGNWSIISDWWFIFWLRVF